MEHVCQYCGKTCKNPNSLRNHERLCKSNPNRQKPSMEGVAPWNKGLNKSNNPILLRMSETSPNKKEKPEFIPYYCERCKKLVDTPYGSNRFCSKQCANSHDIKDEQKRKISKTLVATWDKKGRKRKNKIPKSILDLSKRTISKILKRANQGCMLCEWNEATCDIHHIKPKKEGGDNSNSNLIVLCPNCHRKVHCHKIELDGDINIEQCFHNWTDYYFVDLMELNDIISKNKK